MARAMLDQLWQVVDWHIECVSVDALDCAANVGQIFANVSHMQWFREELGALAD